MYDLSRAHLRRSLRFAVHRRAPRHPAKSRPRFWQSCIFRWRVCGLPKQLLTQRTLWVRDLSSHLRCVVTVSQICPMRALSLARSAPMRSAARAHLRTAPVSLLHIPLGRHLSAQHQLPSHEQPPLHGIKVVDFGTHLAGPLVGRIFSDSGASVTAVTPPGGPLWKHDATQFLTRGVSAAHDSYRRRLYRHPKTLSNHEASRLAESRRRARPEV